MTHLHPSVDEAAAFAKERGERLGRRGRRNGRIQVRRFAGHMAHVGKLEHIRIAHLTDLHVGRVTPMRVQLEAVELTNRENPDLVLITGDFVGHSQMYLDQLHEIVRSFRAPVMAVLGNHDYWSGADEVRRALGRAGAEVLSNAHTTITLRHQRLQVVGVDDAYTGHADREQAVKALRKDLPTIAMSHIAEEADGLWHDGIPLVLAGHTHAGQVTLAGLHEWAVGDIFGHRYVHGLYGAREHNGHAPGALYVGAGIGAAVVPLRLGERGQREVALFDLGHLPGSVEEHHGEQQPRRGRGPSPRKQYLRATAVERKHQKRERRANRRNNRTFFDLGRSGKR